METTTTNPNEDEEHHFPRATLDPVVSAYVSEAAAALMCSESMVSLAVLAVLASCIGPSYSIRIKEGWPEPAILFVLLIAPPGGSKTPVMSRVVGDLHAAEVDSAAALLRLLDAMRSLKPIVPEQAEGLGDGALETPTLPDDPDEEGEPASPSSAEEQPYVSIASDSQRALDLAASNTRVLTDVTQAGLLDFLAESERGTLLHWDELGDALSERASDMRKQLLELYSGSSVNKRRSRGSNRDLSLANPRINVLTGTQPQSLKRIANKSFVESGLLARMTMVYRRSPARSWTTKGMDETAVSAFRRVLVRLMEWQRQSATPHLLPLSGEAQAIFGAFFERLEREKVGLGDSISTDFLSKLPGLAGRFALVLELARSASGETSPDEVSAEAVSAAIEIAQWVYHEQLRVIELLGLESAKQQSTGVLSRAQQVLAEMSPDFKTAEFEKAVSVLFNQTDRSARSWLSMLVQEGRVVSLGGGNYRKSEGPTPP